MDLLFRLKLVTLARRFFCLRQLQQIPPIFFAILGLVTCISFVLLYSAGQGVSPWCIRQFVHFVIGVCVMGVIASTPIRLWYSFAYVCYVFALGGLALTAVLGSIGMGAQRWLTIASIRFQPSELMRIALILAIARRVCEVPVREQSRKLFIPCMMAIVPVLITIKQPDLGTAMLLAASSISVFFFAGMRWRVLIYAFAGFISGAPIFWCFLHDYQKNRILTFLNPANDPLGSGYHIIQSQIAIGSGGFWGKGFMHGTQGSLDFLPEKHTDFIFTLLSEEFGFMGVLLLLSLYSIFIFFNLFLATSVKDEFARLTITGLTISFALYAIINIAMVVGLLPVVGIPLPLVSYGGTSLITLLISQGIVLSASKSRGRHYHD